MRVNTTRVATRPDLDDYLAALRNVEAVTLFVDRKGRRAQLQLRVNTSSSAGSSAASSPRGPQPMNQRPMSQSVDLSDSPGYPTGNAGSTGARGPPPMLKRQHSQSDVGAYASDNSFAQPQAQGRGAPLAHSRAQSDAAAVFRATAPLPSGQAGPSLSNSSPAQNSAGLMPPRPLQHQRSATALLNPNSASQQQRAPAQQQQPQMQTQQRPQQQQQQQQQFASPQRPQMPANLTPQQQQQWQAQQAIMAQRARAVSSPPNSTQNSAPVN